MAEQGPPRGASEAVLVAWLETGQVPQPPPPDTDRGAFDKTGKESRLCFGLLPDFSQPVVKWDKHQVGLVPFVKRYNNDELMTCTGLLRTFTGTTLADPILWWNQLSIVLFVASIVAADLFLELSGLEPRWLEGWILENEDKSRSFMQVMQSFVAFLLGFYVSISVGRWWIVRTSGIGRVTDATRELMFYLSSFVTRDATVLSAIRRYSAVSLLLFYCDRRDKDFSGTVTADAKWDYVQEHCALTDEEVSGLKGLGDPSLGCWVWITHIIAGLDQRGLIKSQAHCQLLMERCSSGSGGLATVKSYITQQLPLTYVHLLTFLVKVHNFFMCIIMGLIASAHVHSLNVVFVTAFLRVVLTTFMFNACLCIGYQLADPFSGDPCDFNVPRLTDNLMSHNEQVVLCSQALPQAVQDKVRSAAAHV